MIFIFFQGICNENDSDVDMIIDPNHLSLDGVSDNRVPADQMTAGDDTVRKEAMQVCMKAFHEQKHPLKGKRQAV